MTLGIFVATAVSRLRFLGVRVAGVDINEIAYLVPMARLASFIWIVGVRATLPRTRRHADAAAPRGAEWLVPQTR